MMAFAWTNTEADCTIVSSEPPEDGIAFVEVEPGTDPGEVYVGADGALQSVPPRPGPDMLFSPVAGAGSTRGRMRNASPSCAASAIACCAPATGRKPRMRR